MFRSIKRIFSNQHHRKGRSAHFVGTKRQRWDKATVRQELWDLQGGRCGIQGSPKGCGRSLSNVQVHIDHRLPISRGGKNNLKNLQLLCRDCNLKAGNRKESEIRRRLKTRNR